MIPQSGAIIEQYRQKIIELFYKAETKICWRRIHFFIYRKTWDCEVFLIKLYFKATTVHKKKQVPLHFKVSASFHIDSIIICLSYHLLSFSLTLFEIRFIFLLQNLESVAGDKPISSAISRIVLY